MFDHNVIQVNLFSKINKNNQLIASNPAVGVEDIKTLCKDAISSACERDIYTGDSATIYVITADGIRMEKMELRKD